MTPLEKHINLLSGYTRFQAEQSDLAPLMRAKAAPGQRALVYRNSGMQALVGALRSNYPRLNSLMGETFFNEMAKAYIHQHPSKHRSLVGYGEQLAPFIDLQSDQHKLVWLGDLARLDRSWLEAHLAADAVPWPLDRIANISHERLLTAALKLHPSLRIVETKWDIGPLWLDLNAGKLPDTQQTLDEIPSAMMFWRPGGVTFAKSLPAEDYAFLKFLLQGINLDNACSLILKTYPDADLAVLIANVVSANLITHLVMEKAPTHENS